MKTVKNFIICFAFNKMHFCMNMRFPGQLPTFRSFAVENAGLAVGRILRHLSTGAKTIMLLTIGSAKGGSLLFGKDEKSLTRKFFTNSGSPTTRLGWPSS